MRRLTLIINAQSKLGLFLSSFYNLTHPVSLLLHFAYELFNFLHSTYLSSLLNLWLTEWMSGLVAGPWCPLFLFNLLLVLFIFKPKFLLFILSAWKCVLSLSCIAIGNLVHFQTNKVFQVGKVTQHYSGKQMQYKIMKHIFASLSKYSTA